MYMEAEDSEKRGRPGPIHHVSDVRWTQGGCEVDIRGGRGLTAKTTHWITHSSALPQFST